jgi:hypothetical protein
MREGGYEMRMDTSDSKFGSSERASARPEKAREGEEEEEEEKAVHTPRLLRTCSPAARRRGGEGSP